MVLLGAGQLIQLIFKRYRSLLQWKVEDKSDIIKFVFTFGSVVRAHLCRYMEKQKQEAVNSAETLQHVVIQANYTNIG